MPLCDVCSRIDVRSLLEAAQQRYKYSEESYSPAESSKGIIPYPWHGTILEARNRQAICDFCAMIWAKIHDRGCGPNGRYTGEGCALSVYVLSVPVISKHDIFKRRREFRLFVKFSNESMVTDHGFWIRHPLKNDPLVNVSSEPLPSYSRSPDCLWKAKTWLASCATNHPNCRRAHEGGSTLPSRVLDVGDALTLPSLRETKGENGSWIALSYCWGGASDFVLNNKTYPGMVEGQPLASFPATIRDAMIIARGLNIRYLWVGALCILQDCKSDWEKEAPRMSETYKNATLTIVAAEASSAYAGIFDHSEPGTTCVLPWKRIDSSLRADSKAENIDVLPVPRPDTLASHGRCSIGAEAVLETVLLREKRKNEFSHIRPNARNSPWASRGWTLQEELLSWRTLTFMKTEMLWDCPSSQVWECGHSRTTEFQRRAPHCGVQRIQPNLGHLAISGGWAKRSFSPLQQGPRQLSTREIHGAWYVMVEEYSQRRLTKDTDKLMAILGLANDVQRYVKDTYCAGLWKNDLIAGLMWTVKRSKARVELNTDSTTPSWSWASLNCLIEWKWKRDISGFDFRGEGQNLTYLAKIEEMHVPNGSSTCELVIHAPTCVWSTDSKGTIRMSGVALPGYFKSEVEMQVRCANHLNQHFLAQQIARFDRRSSGYQAFAILVLRAAQGQDSETLLSTGGGKVYRRISLVYLNSSDMSRWNAGDWEKEMVWPTESVRII